MRSASADTAAFVAALISPQGRGAVATWRILGTPADISRLPFATVRHIRIQEQPVGRLWFGYWNEEEAVITRAGTHEWELSIHGGHAAGQRVRAQLVHLGCTILEWEKLPPRGKSTLEAEFDIAATKSVTWTTTAHLLRHPTHEWIAELQQWRLVFVGQPSATQREQFVSRCSEWLSWSQFGRHLTLPYTVALVGEPNVGKSSLLNRLAGFERAIVQDRPGTTRDLVAVDASFCGYPFSLTDTAGLRATTDRLESEGISRTQRVLKDSDLILHLADISTPPSEEEQKLSERFPHALRVAHKCDRLIHPQRHFLENTLQVSSLTGEGLDNLTAAIVAQLIPRIPDRHTIFPVTDRQIDLLQFLHANGGTADPEKLTEAISELLLQDHEQLPANS